MIASTGCAITSSTGAKVSTTLARSCATSVDWVRDRTSRTKATATSNGTLRLSGVGLGVGGTFTQDDIDSGRVTYDHDGLETVSDSFDFSLADGGEDGATADTGTFNITVTAVNDTPLVGTNTGMTVSEGSTGNGITTAMLEEMVSKATAGAS